MKKSDRLILLIILLCILIITCIIFRTFLLESVIKPVAKAFWLMLRFTILSIDQAILWGLMISVFVIIFIFSLNLIKPPGDYFDPGVAGFHLQRHEIWESYFIVENHDFYKRSKIKKELAKILVYVYAARKRLSADYRLYDVFKNREIELPENIYSFLFTEEESYFSLQKLFYKLSGREAGDYKRNLRECIVFLENFMEISDE
jgi:hypothetical protein